MNGEIDQIIDENCYLGYSFEKACAESKISYSEKKLIKENLIKFTKSLIYEIRAKLPTNFKILESISAFSVTNIFSCNMEDTKAVIKEFVNDYKEIEELENCIRNLKLYKWKNLDRSDAFWIEVHHFKNSTNENPFHKLSSFVLRLLTLPYSNAEVERTFSVMNFFKNKVRNRMSLNTSNCLIHIKYGLKRKKCCCSDYEIPEKVCLKINSNETYKKSQYFIKSVLWTEEDEDDNAMLCENNELNVCF